MWQNPSESVHRDPSELSVSTTVLKRNALFGPDKQKMLFWQIACRLGTSLKAGAPRGEPGAKLLQVFVCLFTRAECGAGLEWWSDWQSEGPRLCRGHVKINGARVCHSASKKGSQNNLSRHSNEKCFVCKNSPCFDSKSAWIWCFYVQLFQVCVCEC